MAVATASGVGLPPKPILKLASRIDARRIIDRDVQVDVAETVEIEAGGTLEIGPGVAMRFAPGTGLSVHPLGRLLVHGTSQAPVIFTSAAPAPQAGDWGGLRFRPLAPLPKRAADYEPSLLEHVIVEYGGRAMPDEFGARGGIAIGTRHVSLRHVELRHNANCGLSSLAEASIEHLRFGHNQGTSAIVAPAVVPSLGRPPETIVLRGALGHSVTLPAMPRPYVVEQLIPFYPSEEQAVLTIERGATIQFMDGGIQLGATGKARLVAHGVTFTSGHVPSTPGDWSGIRVVGESNGVLDLEDCVIEYAGLTSGGGGAAILFPVKDPGDLHLVNCLFQHNSGPALDTAKRSCAPWAKPALKNRSIGQPFCR